MDKQLWAPWREQVIYQRRTQTCIFCTKPKEGRDRENFIFMRRQHSFAMLNRYPYNNGHILVVPYRHVKSLRGLKEQEVVSLALHLQDCQSLLKRLLKPHGFNVGLNEGRVAGAGFKDHVHFHIVPRWEGDTNYMPVLSKTKVISESLKVLYQKIIDAHTR